MSKAPPIPPEQRAFKGQRPDIQGSNQGRRDAETGLQSATEGDADANLDEQGRFGNRRQNVDDVQHKVQDR
ncbi:MAG TPA: hypothetical protein VEA44_12405 [Caulobacter sp.]|nr:hypothetical protein [Caulobacter sp.]